MTGYIVAIDQSTSASKIFLVNEDGTIVRRAAYAHRQMYPAPGYVEHDADEIYTQVLQGVRDVLDGIEPSLVRGIGLCNQRETTVLWDRETGLPVCPAIVWQDVRARALCDTLMDHSETVLSATGLALSPYYSAAKAAHALRADPALARMAADGALCIATLDAYLLYRLTGGQVFATDMTNASRTSLMNLRTLSWDREVCGLFGIPLAALPERILPSDATFGRLAVPDLPPIPITALLGDSHASLFGHGCLTPGTAKATYGTGSSVMMNIGAVPVLPGGGLSASVAFGFGGAVYYALEGNITSCGDTLRWLRDEAGLIHDMGAIEGIARTVPDTGGVTLVPAFSGLGAPYFDENARALLCGMNRGTTNAHILRAALESIALQDVDILQAMARESRRPLTQLHVDGTPTQNALLMQMQADLAACDVLCSAASELSALGAAYMAGISAGLYAGLEDIPQRQKKGAAYHPQMAPDRREAILRGWKLAVARARLSWDDIEGEHV